MGESDRENVKWLLQFIRLDIPTQTVGTLIDVTNKVHSLPLGTGKARGVAAWGPDLGIGKGRVFEPPIAFLQGLQQRLLVGVDTLEKGGAWRLPDAPSEWILIADPEFGGLRRQYISKTEPAFFAAVADLLFGAWSSIRRCLNPTCRARFLPTKPRQKYCSPACSDKVRQAAYLPKRKRDYQVEYEKRIAKRLPAGARVKANGRLITSAKTATAKRTRAIDLDDSENVGAVPAKKERKRR